MTATGAHDFDFVYGTWNVHNTKLRDTTDPTCDEWVEFGATSEVFPILHGYGHIDRMVVPDPPDGEPFEGFTLRLFDPDTERWSIWWSSTRTPGRLDVPVEGAFDGTHGTFECDDVVAGRGASSLRMAERRCAGTRVAPVVLRGRWRQLVDQLDHAVHAGRLSVRGTAGRRGAAGTAAP